MVNTARSQSALDNLEASALAENQILCRHAHVVEGDVAVAMGGVVVAVDLEHSLDGDSRKAGRDQDDGLLLVRVGVVGIGLAHDDVELAPRVASAAGPPLGAVQDVVIAVLCDLQLDVGGIRGRNLRLGHQKRRADLALHQRLEPLLLLLGVAVLGHDLHVARVGSSAVARLGGAARAAQPLRHDGVLEVRPAGGLGVEALGQEHVPQAQLARLVLELLDDGRVVLPAVIALAHLGL